MQALLDELTKAMLCLTDSRRRAMTMARWATGSTDRKKHSLEDILLTRKIVDQEQLKKRRTWPTPSASTCETP